MLPASISKPSNEQAQRQTTRVVLADDHAIVRAGIRRILRSAPDIEVIGEASDGAEALQLVTQLKPDVLLLDMEMPVLNGVVVARLLKAAQSRVRILALSAYDDEQYIVGLLENGAAGYLTKEEVPKTIIEAVRGIAQGDIGWMSERVASRVPVWSEEEHPPS